jgi:Rrf2 family transcriptional regulator, iron-sulfur cluster assembly transcription factor
VSQLSQTAEYALRAMSELALTGPETVVPAASLSKRAAVPQHYLSKIMRKLATAKLVYATKGPGGGFRLARPKKSIRFLDIMAAVGEEPNPDHCAFGWARCNPRAPCPMHPAFSKLNEGTWQWATSTTLADIQPSGRRR